MDGGAVNGHLTLARVIDGEDEKQRLYVSLLLILKSIIHQICLVKVAFKPPLSCTGSTWYTIFYVTFTRHKAHVPPFNK